jgi:molybdenum cofactor biosynthesis protein B
MTAMPTLDESRPFLPVRFAVLTVSDTRTRADDKSGGVLAERLTAAGHTLAARAIARDDISAIVVKVAEWIADPGIDVVLTTGGTGFTGRDVTPDAVRPLFEKEIDGFAAVFHAISFQNIGTSTLQSRACAGLAGQTFIFCLPGSPGACKDAWDGILVHQFDNRHRPCNFVEIMPRLSEGR